MESFEEDLVSFVESQAKKRNVSIFEICRLVAVSLGKVVENLRRKS